MRHRSRLRRWLKWTGTLACMLILLAAAACLRWKLVTVHLSHVRTGWCAGISGGAVFVSWNSSKDWIYDGWFSWDATTWRAVVEDWAYWGRWVRRDPWG